MLPGLEFRRVLFRSEPDGRRAVQAANNRDHGIEPVTIVKGIRDINDRLRAVAERTGAYGAGDGRELTELTREQVEKLVGQLEAEMRNAAKNLEYERAAALRDEIQGIRLRGLEEDASLTVARAAESAGRRASGEPRRAEVTEVRVLPATEQPLEPDEGTAADWLPGIRDEHEDDGGWQGEGLPPPPRGPPRAPERPQRH